MGIVVVEFGGKAPLFLRCFMYAGIFSDLQKVRIITYIMFYGLYSIAKHIFEAFIKNKNIQYAAKWCSSILHLLPWILQYDCSLSFNLYWWMLAAAQAAFLIYDYAFTVFITST